MKNTIVVTLKAILETRWINLSSSFLLYRKVLETFLYNKKNKMSTRTRRKSQLKLTVLGSQSGASPS